MYQYDSVLYIDRPGLSQSLFSRTQNAICFMSGDRQEFSAIATKSVPNLNMFSADAIQYVPRFSFDLRGKWTSNVTDWALEKFQERYKKETASRKITKDDIFYYVYGVLHDPTYRQKYAVNLKREFPRIPFYTRFFRVADIGKKLMALHLDYMDVAPWSIKRQDAKNEGVRKAGMSPKLILRAEKVCGSIVVDDETTLTHIPDGAWAYKLGNRCALDWVLDRFNERTPRDPTIAAKFNTYRFSDHKDRVIELIARIIRVSIETGKLLEEMGATIN
jgi:predicted helicase